MKPILFSTSMVEAIIEGRKTQTRRTIKEPFQSWSNGEYSPEWYDALKTQCKYGQVGDVLWVREKWQHNRIPSGSPYFYYADESNYDREHSKWKPSIHMPKDACRLFLKINNIRVERLQDISEEDAYKEGCDKKLGHKFNISCGESLEDVPHRFIFSELWKSINGKESWDANPLVWVIEFERIEKP